MKIAMVSTALSRGGAARMAATLASALTKLDRGLDVTLYHSEDRLTAPNAVGMKRPFSRQINAFLSRLAGSTLVWDMGFAHSLTEKTSDADLLHLHNLHGYYLDYIGLLRAWKHRPIVWTWHDMWGATGRCAFSFECDNWRTGCRRCPNKNYYPAAWFDHAQREFSLKDRLFAELSNLMIVTPAEWLKHIAIERGFSEAQVSTIPNPVDLSSYNGIAKERARAALGLSIDSPILLFVAADCSDPRKGFSAFNDIVATVGAMGVAVGKPPARKQDGILCVGPAKDAEELSLYYSAADAYVLTSEADNYPNTVIEAQACGTPVFGFNVGGVESQVLSPFGAIAKKGDTNALAKKLASFLLEGGKTSQQVREIRHYAKRKWEPQRIAALYADLYNTAIERN